MQELLWSGIFIGDFESLSVAPSHQTLLVSTAVSCGRSCCSSSTEGIQASIVARQSQETVVEQELLRVHCESSDTVVDSPAAYLVSILLHTRAAMANRGEEQLKVFVRVRPPIFKEVKQETAVFVQGQQMVSLSSEKQEVKCTYDHVFNELTDQEEVFERVKPLLSDVVRGVNACIFAYGQTSAGKSYTMIGPNGGQDILRIDKSKWGVLPRASEFLLGYLNEKAQEGFLQYEVKASFLQIYNENLYDLLRDTGPMIEDKLTLSEKNQDYELKIREVPRLSGKKGKASGVGEVFVSGLSEFRVQTSEDILRILAVGTNNRMTRSTDFNFTSSRSHAILQLTLDVQAQDEVTEQTTIFRSKLNLVDLAGSEKIPFIHSDLNNAKHMKELTSINKSLSALGNVIAALSSSNRSHIPYRDSKLTRILQDSLSGNTRTVLIACVAPTVLHTAESFSTLQFADRAKSVILTVKANAVIDEKAVLNKANIEIARLKGLLAQALKQVEDLTKVSEKEGGSMAEVQKLNQEKDVLKKENKSLKKQIKVLNKQRLSMQQESSSYIENDYGSEPETSSPVKTSKLDGLPMKRSGTKAVLEYSSAASEHLNSFEEANYSSSSSQKQNHVKSKASKVQSKLHK